jgi:hypothetical protein
MLEPYETKAVPFSPSARVGFIGKPFVPIGGFPLGGNGVLNAFALQRGSSAGLRRWSFVYQLEMGVAVKNPRDGWWGR